MLTNSVDSVNGAPDPPPVGPTRTPRKTGLWIAGGVTLAGCIAVGVIDPNTTQIFPACAFKSMTGLDCPGCGMTRGLHALLGGDVLRAVSHNALLIVLLVATGVYVTWNMIAARLGRRRLRFEFRRSTWITVGLGVFAFWTLRNLPWSPFDWLGSNA